MKENTRSTDYNGALPATRADAREDGTLWEYAHMYDVIKEDKQRLAAVDEETAERKAADAAEAKARKDADAAEEAARKSADAAIYAAIDKEADARIAADSALSARVDEIDTTLAGVATKTELEAKATEITTAYQAADQNIIDQSAEAIQAEQNARTKAVGALNSIITAEISRAKVAEEANANSITAETTAREAKDAELEAKDAELEAKDAELETALSGKVNEAELNIIFPWHLREGGAGGKDTSIAIGRDSYADGNISIAMGQGASTQGDNLIAIGTDATVYGGIGIGHDVVAQHEGSIAFGGNAKTTEDYQVVFGSTDNPMKLSNVRAGEADTDAVNKKQLDDAVNLQTLDTRVSSTLATYLKTLPDIEHGYSDALSLAGGASTSFNVTFSSTKTEAPQVLVSVMGNGVSSVVAVVQSSTTTGTTVKVTNLGSSAVSNVTVDWLALSGR